MKTESLDLPLIEQQLNIDKYASVNDLPWLEESYSSPLSFWQSLKNTHNSFLPWPTKSTPFKGYDFYHDIIIRNRENSAPAFCYYNPNYGWRETSYSELGELASKKAAVWNRYGVQPGQKICIVLPLGHEYAVSLLAALKLGLVVSCLPPQGKTFLQTRLEILAPDFITSDDTYSLLLPDWQDKLLQDIGSAESTNVEKESSYSYYSGDIIGYLFDPASENSHVPRELTSDAAYLCPLRDGFIALGLRPGDVFGAPGFHFLETQPALLLAVLLNGGTYLHLEEEDIEREPELLNAYHIKSIGISCRIREILLQKSITIQKPWSYWFRNPLESIDFDRWEHFIQVLKIDNVFAGNMLWMASFGGCSLFSIKRKGLIHFSVLPSAGIAWDLADLVSGNPETLQSYGKFTLSMVGKDERLPTTYILARNRNEWLFAGSSKSARAGRSYPKTEILDVIRDNSNCKSCSIVEMPKVGINNDSFFILLVFVGTGSNISDVEVAKQIQEIIKREMGDEFLPDKIQFFPFYPRLNSDNSIDHDWCLGQYTTGALFRKTQEDIYHCLAQIRKHFFPL